MIYKTYKYLQRKELLVFKLGMIGICLTANVALAHSNLQKSEKLEIFESIGGNFTLQSSRNHLASLKDYHGQVVVMFFGYTTCPDTCSITMAVLKQVIEKLGKRMDQVQPLFITVDPKRDTPEQMKTYLSFFHPNFIGLTGTKEEILEVAENSFEKVCLVNISKIFSVHMKVQQEDHNLKNPLSDRTLPYQ